MISSKGENPKLDDLLRVFSSLLTECGANQRDLVSLTFRSHKEGMSFLTKTLPLLGKAFDLALGSGQFKLPSNFKKRWRGSEIPAFCGSLFARVFHRNGQIRSNVPPDVVKNIRQILFFAYKLVLPFNDDICENKVKEFIATDNALPDFRYRASTVVARNLTEEVFSSYDGEIFPSHGPGVVSNLEHRDKFTFVPPLTDCVRHFGIRTYSLDREFFVYVFAMWWNSFFRSFTSFCPNDLDFIPYHPVAKIILVPKDSRGPRLISCEPAEHQFVQQGIRKWTQKQIESHPVSSGQVNFSDQTINRDLVKIHSVDKEYSTLDLKDASDRVSLELVEYLFGDCSHYLADLLACRTEWTRYESEAFSVCHKLRKFAPMGSALCFTTLAWCVYSLLIGDLIVEGLPLEEAKQVVYVYGDDVICETWYAKRAADVLEFHGLLVNHQKSFINSNFLESCGEDSFFGNTVTPIRARRLVPVCNTSPMNHTEFHSSHPARTRRLLTSISNEMNQTILSSTSLAQNLQLGGFPATAELLYSSVENYVGQLLPYGLLDSPYLCRLTSSTELAWITNETMGIDRKGHVMAIKVVPVKTEISEDGYSRLRRTLPQIVPNSQRELDQFGEYVAPKSIELRYGKLNRFYQLAYG